MVSSRCSLKLIHAFLCFLFSLWQSNMTSWTIYHLVRWCSQRTKPPWLVRWCSQSSLMTPDEFCSMLGEAVKNGWIGCPSNQPPIMIAPWNSRLGDLILLDLLDQVCFSCPLDQWWRFRIDVFLWLTMGQFLSIFHTSHCCKWINKSVNNCLMDYCLAR